MDDLSTTLFMGKLHAVWRRGGVGLGAAQRESRRWLRSLHRARPSALTGRLAGRPAGVLPGPAGDLAALRRDAEASLGSGPERPFADPHFWAAFFVAGDGAITSDGADRRAPAAPGGGDPS